MLRGAMLNNLKTGALLLLAFPPVLGVVMFGLATGVARFVFGMDLDWNDPDVQLWGTILGIPLWLVGAAIVMKWADIK